MNFRDRVKQTATASSDTSYTMTNVTPPAGYRTFRVGYNAPTVAALGGTVIWQHVSVLVEPADTPGAWQIVVGDVVRVDDTYMTFIAGANGFVASSSTGAPLGLTGDEACTLTVIGSDTSWRMMALMPAAFTGPFPGLSGSNSSNVPTVANAGLMALGPRSYVNTKLGVAIGDTCYAPGQGTFNHGFGCPISTTDLSTQWGSVIRQARTTNTTATPLGLYDRDGAISGAEWLSQDFGLSRFVGTLFALDEATGDHKVWTVDALIKTTEDYSSTSLIGTAFTVRDASAGAASWAVTIVFDEQDFKFEVTGEAATNIIWSLHVRRDLLEVYP